MNLTDAQHQTTAAGAAARFEYARRTARLAAMQQPRTAPPAGMSITGQVVRAANAHASPGRHPRALLSVVVSTGSMRFAAVMDCGTSFQAHLLAHNMAHSLQLGEWATIDCTGVTVQRESSDTALVCTGVRSIKRAWMHG